jgi:hypothetical protein
LSRSQTPRKASLFSKSTGPTSIRLKANLGFYASQGVLAVYGTSVLRTVALAGWLVGPFSVAFGVIGNVLFYLQPNPTHPAAIGEECRKRLRAALTYAGRLSSDAAVVVAHSQGSVIAVDLRQRGELEFPLLTLGSPPGSLYHFTSDFLAMTCCSDSARDWRG